MSATERVRVMVADSKAGPAYLSLVWVDAMEIALGALEQCNREHAEVMSGFRGHTHAQTAIERMAQVLEGKDGEA